MSKRGLFNFWRLGAVTVAAAFLAVSLLAGQKKRRFFYL
jgi:hypothetical protein